MVGLPMNPLLHTSCRQVAICPPVSRSAETRTSMADPIGGQDISSYSAKQLTTCRRDAVGFVVQAVNLVPFLTARENLKVVNDFGNRRSQKEARASGASSTEGAAYISLNFLKRFLRDILER